MEAFSHRGWARFARKKVKRELFMECFGTMALLYVVEMTTRLPSEMLPAVMSAVLMVVVYLGVDISGAHYNPMVTTALWMRGLVDPDRAVAYVNAQLTGE